MRRVRIRKWTKLKLFDAAWMDSCLNWSGKKQKQMLIGW